MIPIKIERREPVMKWIPVTERLPEEEEEVLICDPYGFIYIAEYEAFPEERWRWVETVEYRPIKGVKAWMPLPEPWKEEKDEGNPNKSE